jgi:hypothetical protein
MFKESMSKLVKPNRFAVSFSLSLSPGRHFFFYFRNLRAFCGVKKSKKKKQKLILTSLFVLAYSFLVSYFCSSNLLGAAGLQSLIVGVPFCDCFYLC